MKKTQNGKAILKIFFCVKLFYFLLYFPFPAFVSHKTHCSVLYAVFHIYRENISAGERCGQKKIDSFINLSNRRIILETYFMGQITFLINCK